MGIVVVALAVVEGDFQVVAEEVAEVASLVVGRSVEAMEAVRVVLPAAIVAEVTEAAPAVTVVVPGEVVEEAVAMVGAGEEA